MTGRWSQLSARTRLTLWYVALLAGTLVTLGVLAQLLTRQSLYASQDDVLRSKAAAVATEADLEKGRLEFPDDGPRNVLPSVASGLDIVRVWDQQGNEVFHQTPGDLFPPVAPSILSNALSGMDGFDTVALDNQSYRLYTFPILRKAGVAGVLQIGRSEAEINVVLGQLRNLSLGGLVVALVVAGLGGSFLSARALRPVDRITSAAERMSAENLSLRLPVSQVDDEFGRQTAAFNAMLERLERAFERQRRFTADASHELRTPLTVIRSLAEVALTSPRSDAYDRRVYTSIAEETERLGGLVESLLVLARADNGLAISLVEVDLDEIVMSVVERTAERAAKESVELILNATHRCRVMGDTSWLTQLVLNLVDNALRHTPPGGQLTIEVVADSESVTVSVTDTGSGIAPEHLPRIFERFYRVDEDRSRAKGGSGLGLAIADWIARAHSGSLSVQSEVGKGTRFTLRIPLAAAPKRTDQGVKASSPGSTAWPAAAGVGSSGSP